MGDTQPVSPSKAKSNDIAQVIVRKLRANTKAWIGQTNPITKTGSLNIFNSWIISTRSLIILSNYTIWLLPDRNLAERWLSLISSINLLAVAFIISIFAHSLLSMQICGFFFL
jgi:hypothetical protein